MKPPPFVYRRAGSVDEAVALLAEFGDEAKILAGGQSLVPMMNFRLARPAALIDVTRVLGLDFLRRDGDALHIGALTTHRAVELAAGPEVAGGFAVLPRAARWIGHFPIRTRGTVGGSLAHADSTAEWCVLAAALDAVIRVTGPGGRREIAAADWFTGFLSTDCAPDEMVTEVIFPRPRPMAALTEYARRQGDFGIAVVAVALEVADGRCSDVAVAVGGVGGSPYRLVELERSLQGVPAGPESWRGAGRLAAELVDPTGDIHGSAAYRKRLVGTLVERALADASAERDGAAPGERGGAAPGEGDGATPDGQDDQQPGERAPGGAA